jgi:hypothetical protein
METSFIDDRPVLDFNLDETDEDGEKEWRFVQDPWAREFPTLLGLP